MAEIFSALGIDGLARLAAAPSALAFDLDGTLAPIVSDPENARVPESTGLLLTALSRRWPLAILTGRTMADARQRLGFSPHYLYGNHGAERANGIHCPTWRMQLNPCRDHLRCLHSELALRKVVVEDKGLSLALHYRANPGATTIAWLDALIAPVSSTVDTSHGHHVMNIMPKNAPDKGDALLEVLQDCGAVQAFMMGDDVNDECAFDKAPPGSITVRIGPLQLPSKAQFTLAAQCKVDELLATLLTLRR